MLILKLTIVPLFIAFVTLAGRRWGASFAGLLSGLPVVAGPIVIFIALEHGVEFGAVASAAAISAIAGLLVFGVAYCWASTIWSWSVALGCGIAAWIVVAFGLASLPATPEVALIFAAGSLLLAPKVLPKSSPVVGHASSANDLPYRMVTGALLTLVVTAASAWLGPVWSGLLAAFPIIGLVLAVFTHRLDGAYQVAHMYRGMVRGLYSFGAFFLVLALLWPRVGFWSTLVLAAGAGVGLQAMVQWIVLPCKRLWIQD